MPSVSLDSDGWQQFALVYHIKSESAVNYTCCAYNNGAGKQVMHSSWIKNAIHRFDNDNNCCDGNKRALDKYREKLNLAVSVRMVLVAGLSSKMDAEKCKGAGYNVDDAFGSIGKHKVGCR